MSHRAHFPLSMRSPKSIFLQDTKSNLYQPQHLNLLPISSISRFISSLHRLISNQSPLLQSRLTMWGNLLFTIVSELTHLSPYTSRPLN